MIIARLKSVGLALGMGIVLLACGVLTAQDIKTNYMPGTDFSKYHTYKWVSVNNAKGVSETLATGIKRSGIEKRSGDVGGCAGATVP